jgi:hypothetical protein
MGAATSMKLYRMTASGLGSSWHAAVAAARWLGASVCLALCACFMGHAAPVGTSVDAIWRTQRLEFHYRSTSASYTCPGLKARLSAILRSVGVHESMAMTCQGSEAARNIEIQLRASSPVEATAANVAAETEYDGKQRLLAHLNGTQLPSAADLPRFSASWQRIDVHRQRQVRLAPGDCELLQQVRKQLLPKFAVEIELDGLNCHAGSATRIVHPLRVVALIPAALRPEAAPQAGQM